jgi:excisionase family DNA binding protein
MTVAPSTASASTMVAARTGRSRQQLISLAEAADRIDVSTRTLRRYIAAGRLTGYRVGPRLIKIDPNELDQLPTTLATYSTL